MNDEIAVLLNRNGETATLYDSYETVVYKNECSRWVPVRSMAFCLSQEMQLPALRTRMSQLTDFLDQCKVFMVRSIGGLPYFELEKCGIRMWEAQGNPYDFMQTVMQDEQGECESALQVTPTDNTAGAVKQVLPGHLQISLREVQVQGSSHGLTSKQVLLPILDKGGFQTLEILCDHVPPWLEAMLLNKEINGWIEQNRPGESKILINVENP